MELFVGSVVHQQTPGVTSRPVGNIKTGHQGERVNIPRGVTRTVNISLLTTCTRLMGQRGLARRSSGSLPV